MNNRFGNKVAIVTGGASGIGASIVQRLAAEGARLVVADLNVPNARGDGMLYHHTDVSSPADVKALVSAAVERFGHIDVLINNAGIGWLAETPDMADEDWNRLFAINVSSIFYACRAAVPIMQGNHGGAILNIASISGLLGDYGMGAYNASKAAVINYTRTLALDCARDNIRVNALCPGAIGGTGMGVGSHGSEEDRQSWRDRIPLGRLGTAQEMANVAAFLVSDEASYMTGSIVIADGGVTAHSGQPNVPAQRRRRGANQS